MLMDVENDVCKSYEKGAINNKDVTDILRNVCKDTELGSRLLASEALGFVESMAAL